MVFETNSRKERKALEAIASVGLIEGNQLQQIFKLKKPQIRRMESFNLIMKHVIRKNGQDVPFYTLGPASAEKIVPGFVPNYWVEYRIEDVLNRFMFFRLFDLLKHQNANVGTAPKPFTGALELNGNLLYVYCTRGDTKDLQMLLKWKPFTDRMIIVTEKIQYLKPLDLFIQDGKLRRIRVITDEQLLSDRPQFYTYKENGDKVFEWVLESNG
ncbi:hypothetical protein [Niallia endozanthoxylica]|uniref:Uncharacterized protein n=1 Tax=Niallia endozanthoxylica TaxID=2036016 RepID=A0A5J5HAJ1_9BACI|nr:hypothetical protein [Niallia endozanthoxylica]KAA9017679.1 hypothetical protein F4V44_20810 [Niallia endozanthoxylica]